MGSARAIDINDRLEDEVETVTSPEEILQVTRDNSDVRVDDKLIDYINQLVRLTRQWPQFHMGASPRAGIAMMQAARTLAAIDEASGLLRGRDRSTQRSGTRDRIRSCIMAFSTLVASGPLYEYVAPSIVHRRSSPGATRELQSKVRDNHVGAGQALEFGEHHGTDAVSSRS